MKKQIKKKKEVQKEAEKQALEEQYQIREVEEAEPRTINKQILKNKGGLQRKRKKIDRNSRVKHKIKYQKAMQKLKSKG